MSDDKIKWHESQIKLAKERIQYHTDQILILKAYETQGCARERQCKAVI